jgi:hypothetical protein
MSKKRFFEIRANYGVNQLPRPAEGDNVGPLFRSQKSQLVLAQLSKRIFDAIKSIESNPDLTPDGKINRAKEIGKDPNILAEVKRGLEMASPLAKNFFESKRAVDELLNFKHTGENVLRRMELRGAIERMPSERRAELLEKAVKAGDREIIAVFADKSDIFELVAPALVNEKVSQFIEKVNPVLARTFKESEIGAKIVFSEYMKFLNDLSEWAGYKPEQLDPLRAMIPPDLATSEWTVEENIVAGTGSELQIDFVHHFAS